MILTLKASFVFVCCVSRFIWGMWKKATTSTKDKFEDAQSGKSLVSVAFKTYGYISMSQALNFVGDFKLGHYMQIPPRSIFIVQLVATVVSSTVCFGTTWWLITSVENICNTDLLPVGSPWTCPSDEVFYNASIIWGVIGPRRMFTKEGICLGMNWFFLVGILAPVPFWYLSKKFPEKKWLKHIHVPLIFSAVCPMPQAKAVHYWSWTIVGVVSTTSS
ncbi:Oligopeptide transporter 1 [Raphanus sativus]|nr:Oligopeptide transporter 1 [Raphanus sativus]